MEKPGPSLFHFLRVWGLCESTLSVGVLAQSSCATSKMPMLSEGKGRSRETVGGSKERKRTTPANLSPASSLWFHRYCYPTVLEKQRKIRPRPRDQNPEYKRMIQVGQSWFVVRVWVAGEEWRAWDAVSEFCCELGLWHHMPASMSPGDVVWLQDRNISLGLGASFQELRGGRGWCWRITGSLKALTEFEREEKHL